MKRILPIFTLLLCPLSSCVARDSVCDIANNHAKFDHQDIALDGKVSALKETTSRAGNDYTIFKLEDGECFLDVFTWGHPPIANGNTVQVQGVFEVEHHQGKYTFYNEMQATKVIPK
jgi:hypothetical protein